MSKMSKRKRLQRYIRNADDLLKLFTRRGLSDYARLGWEYGKESLRRFFSSGEEEQIDPEDRADCELLGISPSCSETVARSAIKVFRIDNHPDRFPDEEMKRQAEERTKRGVQAFERICRRRGWLP